MSGQGRGVPLESPVGHLLHGDVFLGERKCFPRQEKTPHTLGIMHGD